jgi:hypothetical protein
MKALKHMLGIIHTVHKASVKGDARKPVIERPSLGEAMRTLQTPIVVDDPRYKHHESVHAGR